MRSAMKNISNVQRSDQPFWMETGRRHQLIDLLFAWITILIVQNPVEGYSSHDLCSSKICSGCIAGSLSCQEGGLTSLPDQLAPDIKSMILTGHRFQNSVLLERNFSNYPLQTSQLQRLTIRNCGITRLEPRALRSLKTLQQLDLSQNKIQVIEQGTFAGLRLDLLRLDENRGLHLDPGAFRDASIVSLSMNQCGLTSLTYEDLFPLLSNNALTNLHLSGNKLFTLENRLEPIFLNLQSLSLEQNPFACDCRISWLADVLRRRQINQRSRSLRALRDEGRILYDDPLDTELNFVPSPNHAPLDGDLLKPACRTPERLVGRPLEALTNADFYCNLPQLRSLEIDIKKSDDSLVDRKRAHFTGEVPTVGLLDVTLRCHVEGSPEMRLSWYRRPSLDKKLVAELGFRQSSQELSEITNSKMIKPGVSELRVSQPRKSTNQNGVNVHSLQVPEIERLVCVAMDLSGNISTEVKLQWPQLLSHLNGQQSFKSDLAANAADQNPYPVAESSGVANEGREQPSASNQLDRVDQSMRSDWYILTGDDPGGFWLQKQFSALQMIGAVVGTFTVTLALFILGCFLLKAQRIHRNCRRSKALLQQSAYQNSSPVTKYTLHTLYTPVAAASVASSDAQRTVAYSSVFSPGCNSDLQNTQGNQLTHQFTTANPTSMAVNNGGTMGTDFGGSKLLPYQAYEPGVTIGEPVGPTQNSYSDSQTYDIPQFPPLVSPPSAPLPPLPVASNTLGNRVNSKMDARGPFLITNISSPVSESKVPANTPAFSSMVVNSPDSLSAAMTMAATLTRMQNQGHVHMNHGGAATSQPQMPLAQNQLFNFVNPQGLMTHQSMEVG
ncbi:unnamed protein product [Calicophoron daubneyi]|uniref:Ig-like domain-containing protein n=1 Tax=Calicophoron daubneyi TaxID=300641 RepID=A0AAV2TVY2_CALDB